MKIWLSAALDRRSFPRSALTYSKQEGRIVDLCVIDNTHSIASASDKGDIHVFSVEHAYQISKAIVDSRESILNDQVRNFLKKEERRVSEDGTNVSNLISPDRYVCLVQTRHSF